MAIDPEEIRLTSLITLQVELGSELDMTKLIDSEIDPEVLLDESSFDSEVLLTSTLLLEHG